MELTATETPVAVQPIGDGVTFLILNRPEAMNALSTGLARSLTSTLERLAGDRSVRVVVLTGAGERAFCAGADLKERREMPPDQWRAQRVVFEGAFHALLDFPKPIFSAVNGVAAGGGCELALNTDFIIAADTARFGQPEVKLGIMPGGGATQHLPRWIALGLARQLLMTGELIGADLALRGGLVNSVHRPAELLDEALRIAKAIAANSSMAVRQVRAAVREGSALSIEDAMSVEIEHYANVVDHPDRYEGIAAFNERRTPKFLDPA